MKILCVLALVGCVAGSVACSDDSSPGGGAGGGGHAGTSTAAAGSAGQATTGGGAGQAATGGGAGQATTGGAPSGTSDYCKMYCQCHETNCASTAIPGGVSCFEFCATFSSDPDLSYCRLNMCTLVPAQPDNNHCVHSVGIAECL